jgi:hypothetical protein
MGENRPVANNTAEKKQASDLKAGASETMRKRIVIIVVCVLGGALAALLALTLLSGNSQPLASITYLGTVTNLSGRYGRFSISNCSDRPIHYIPSLVQFSSNGIVHSVSSPSSPNMEFQPHHVETFQLAVPPGVRRWHGLVNVGQEMRGLASLPLRIRWTVHYGFSYARTNGILSPTGKIHDGRLVATPEVYE